MVISFLRAHAGQATGIAKAWSSIQTVIGSKPRHEKVGGYRCGLYVRIARMKIALHDMGHLRALSVIGPTEDRDGTARQGDGWRYYEQIADVRSIELSHRKYLLGVNADGPVYLALIDSEGVEDFVCEFGSNHHVMSVYERLTARSLHNASLRLV